MPPDNHTKVAINIWIRAQGRRGELEGRRVCSQRRAHDLTVRLQRRGGKLERGARGGHCREHDFPVAPQVLGGVPQRSAVSTHRREHKLPVGLAIRGSPRERLGAARPGGSEAPLFSSIAEVVTIAWAPGDNS